MMELIPLIGGGLFGAIVKLISISMQNKADAHKRTMEAFKARDQQIQHINETATTNSGFAFTRRTIALAITSIIVVVALVPYDQGINVVTEVKTGGSYLFGLIDTTKTEQVWTTLKGLVILPVVSSSFQAIVGAYFGASIASNK